MSTTSGDDGFEVEFVAEIEAELSLAESSGPEEAAALPVSQWLFDPVDVEREEVGLRNLLDAAEELEGPRGDGRSGTS
ncbi:hypothetical protein [Actinomadura sp. 3N508]|uniref:hypothetical protein n=1 Tax=Actinomadura sp. 3N508 TaxID=3375153 RepID=UPI00378C525A